jgi:hypothetical protein
VEKSKAQSSVIRSAETIYNVSKLSLDDFYDSKTGSELMQLELAGDVNGMLHQAVAKARDEADTIIEKMEDIEEDVQQDTFLLQRFLVDCMRGIERNVALRYMLLDDDEDQQRMWKSILCLIAIVLYVIFLNSYIFLFGVRLGPAGVQMWLTGCIIAFCQSVFILQPANVFVQFLLMPAVPSIRIRTIHGLLRKRAIPILRRQVTVRDAGALIQHLSPACRAARRVPHLHMAKLLLSLNDYDLPVDFLIDETYKMSYLQVFTKFIMYLGFILALFIVLLLPNVIGDALMESSSSLGINILIGVGYTLSEAESVVMPVSIAIGVLTLIIAYYFYYRKYSSHTDKVGLTRAIEIENDDIATDEEIEIYEAEIRMKESNYKSWRSQLSYKKYLNEASNLLGSSFDKSSLELDLSPPIVAKKKPLPSISALIQRGVLPEVFSTSTYTQDSQSFDSPILQKYSAKVKQSMKTPTPKKSPYLVESSALPSDEEIWGASIESSSRKSTRSRSKATAVSPANVVNVNNSVDCSSPIKDDISTLFDDINNLGESMDQTDNDSGNEMTNMQIRVKRRANRVKRKSKKQNAKSNLNATASAFSPFSPFTPKTSNEKASTNTSNPKVPALGLSSLGSGSIGRSESPFTTALNTDNNANALSIQYSDAGSSPPTLPIVLGLDSASSSFIKPSPTKFSRKRSKRTINSRYAKQEDITSDSNNSTTKTSQIPMQQSEPDMFFGPSEYENTEFIAGPQGFDALNHDDSASSIESIRNITLRKGRHNRRQKRSAQLLVKEIADEDEDFMNL